MKHLSILLLSTFLLFFSISQAQYGHGSPEVYNDIKKKKLVVVSIDKADKFNKYVKEYITTHWQFGKHEFITEKEFKSYKNKNVYFLAIKKMGSGNANINSNVGFFVTKFITISQSNKSHFMFNDAKHNAYTILPQNEKINNLSKEHVNLLLNTLFSTIKEFKNKKYKATKTKDLKKVYNLTTEQTFASLKKKTLLIPTSNIVRNDMNMTGKEFKNDRFLNPKEIAKYYTGKFKLVNETEMAKLLATNKDKYIVLNTHEEGTYLYYFLYDLASNKVTYFNKVPPIMGVYSAIPAFKKMLKLLSLSLIHI